MAMEMSEDKLMISIFLALEGVHAYSAFLPSVFTIKTFVSTEEGVAMIREGEIMASIFLFALASTTVVITKSILPLLLGVITGAGMIAVYEYALARAPIGEDKKEPCDCEDEKTVYNDGYGVND